MLIPWTPRRSWYLHNPDTWKDLEISLTVEGHRDVKISGIFECWRFWHSWEDRILKKSSQLNSLKLVVSRYFFYIPKFQIFRFFKLSLAFEIYCQLKRVQSYMGITSLVWKKSVLNLTSFGSVAFFFSTSTVLDIDFCAFGVESFAFYVPEILCIKSHVFPSDTELGTAIVSVVFASL